MSLRTILAADMPSEMSSTLLSDEKTSQRGALLERFNWDDISFDSLRRSIEPIKRSPPSAESRPEGYTDKVLQERQQYLDLTLAENPYKTPSVWRFASCYKHFISRARVTSSRKQKLQTRRQILLFDRAQSSIPCPCESPATQLGNVYLSSAIVLLRYTVYTRYQAYLGRSLRTFSYAIRPTLRSIWHDAYAKLTEESEHLSLTKASLGGEKLRDINDVIMLSISHRINQLLRVRPLTLEKAMESLEKYSRHPDIVTEAVGGSTPEVNTFELENLVRTGNYRKVAHILYSDFVTLDSLMRFEEDDVEIIHLQAIINGLIKAFFDVNCSMGQHNQNIGNWQPTEIFRAQQTAFLRDGGKRFSDTIRWMLTARADKAEEDFSRSWTALWRSGSEDNKGAQELLAGYMRTLNVEIASVEDHR